MTGCVFGSLFSLSFVLLSRESEPSPHELRSSSRYPGNAASEPIPGYNIELAYLLTQKTIRRGVKEFIRSDPLQTRHLHVYDFDAERV